MSVDLSTGPGKMMKIDVFFPNIFRFCVFINFRFIVTFLLSVQDDYGFGRGQGAGVSSWLDLTERLKKVGAYEKYLEWREGTLH